MGGHLGRIRMRANAEMSSIEQKQQLLWSLWTGLLWVVSLIKVTWSELIADVLTYRRKTDSCRCFLRSPGLTCEQEQDVCHWLVVDTDNNTTLYYLRAFVKT